MASPPDLMPELLGEILVRFPPDEPACLVRASLVCKAWRHLLCDPAFRRRYISFHRAPPLLGFLHTLYTSIHHEPRPRFVSTIKPSTLPLQAFLDHGCGWHWRVLDCRHGRVLFQAPYGFRVKLVVLDPASGEQKLLPDTPLQQWERDYTAAVLCAVRGCDHLDCDDGPFLVVLLSYNVETVVLQSHLYSSETSTWSSSRYLGLGFRTVDKPSVVIGDDIYFLVAFRSLGVLKVNLEKNHLSIINLPEAQHDFEWNKVLILWSRNVMNLEVGGGWARCRVIELRKLIPFKHRIRVVGSASAEGSGIIFVASDVGVFSLDIKLCRDGRLIFMNLGNMKNFPSFPS